MEGHVLTLIDNLNPEECDVTVFCAFSEWLAPVFEELNGRRVRLYTTSNQDPGWKLANNKGFRGAWMRSLRWALGRLSLEKTLRQTTTELCWILSAWDKLAAAELGVIHFHAGRLVPLYWPLIASRLVRIPTRILTLHNAAKKRSGLARVLERIAL
jgi:hypothetical protein